MTTQTFDEVVEKVRTLSVDERKRLINVIVDTFTAPSASVEAEPRKKRSILEYEGVGEHLRDMDAQEYINQLRSEWDHRP